jgi:hypothetical protein
VTGKSAATLGLALTLLAGCLGTAAVEGAGSGSSKLAEDAKSANLPCAVADALARRCTRCHQSPPLYGAPMPLMTWADTQAPAVSDPSKKVYELMASRIHDAQDPMPPMGLLPAPELAVIDSWVAAGAPSSDETCSTNTDGGLPDVLPCQPDQSIAPANPWPVTSQQSDEYVCYGIDITTTEKRQAIAIAPRIQNKRVVHHLDLFQAPEAFGREPRACTPFTSSSWRMIYAWAPGGQNLVLPSEAGFPLEGTTHYVVQVHYANVAHLADQTDASGVDVCTTSDLRPNDADVVAFGTDHFTVPPRSLYDLTCDASLPAGADDIHVFAVMPHMHNIGRSLVNTLLPAGGGAMDLGAQRNWNVNNQSWFPVHATVRPGDVVSTRCTWTNNGADSVSFGDTAADEMCYAYSMYYPRITVPSFSWVSPAKASVCRTTQ